MKKQKILFDLDGTIIDSSQGIFASLNYAMKEMNRNPLDSKTLKSFIGPPLVESFIKTGMTEEEAKEAVDHYRTLYKKEGMYQVTLYDGIQEVLTQLAERYDLFLATSKPEFFAVKIIHHLELAEFFEGIYGADLDGIRSEKRAVIHDALKAEKVEELSTVVMIGDRAHDIIGAKENNIDNIGVLYGFGDKEELVNAGAQKIVAKPRDLLDVFQ
ncbi:HAD hydrolase-like protein [Tetragenococcus halophilus]|uniref:Phosphatase n=1 Tax=Tetragenococcus halophilus (strain DSM 20338 / JCM 20259 / NCIMB 9735 / NBRC 12172) TaxID=945021 RepID=A0AAN1SGS7_TETHN|nr:HAD hydrolase-like protein [Tetragenococcus halophilus]MCO7027056.1 HAD hydrolase-like protein [Tetragenococcus halophilus]NWO00895.1 HAD hydrolase-like protein [Tetragenococcus halophilus]QXN86259.1 HAD hydrolase-like protein [Tetragenococcus halophilus]RQD29202.1 hydrolase [Tetragenococcus halophilus subsp. halophilus DSM 20339]WJS81345.1 HAD hydrolase-like protein [Tetragenococcus halophilus]